MRQHGSFRIVLAALVAVVGAASVARVAAAPPQLGSPRAVFETFLGAMVDVKQGRAERIDDAVACFDLESVPGLVRAEAPRIAADLKTYLDKTELVDVASLPREVEGDRWVYRRTTAGEISLVKRDDRWLFSARTVASLDDLLASVSHRGFVAGIEGGGGGPATLADWVRERLPAPAVRRVFILENWQWLALVVLAFVGVVLDRLVRVVVGVWLRRLLARSGQLREHGLDAGFGKPVGIFAMALFWWGLLRLLGLPLTALAALKLASELMMAAAAVWAIYRLVDVLAAHFSALASQTESRIDDVLVPLVRRAVKIVVLAFVILFVAQNLNVDITSLLAGLGIGGIAFALAAKDTVENLFGSLTVLVDRHFQIGDWVVIGDQEGTVEEIGFRTTRLRTFYNSKITIPNSHLVRTPVDNLGARQYRRVKCMIGVQYDTPAEKLEAFCEGIRALIREHPYTRKDYYMVYFNEFASSSLNILLYAFHETPDWATELRERHRLFIDIVRLARRLGVEFAFPTQTLHVASMPHPAGASSPDAPAASPETHDGAIRLGREQAEAIVRGQWPGEAQAPVAFDDPETIRPGAAGERRRS